MVNRINLATIGIFAVLCGLAPAADGTVSGSGAAEVRVMPEAMRVRIELVAKGKDLKEALEQLKGRRATAREKLVGLGASKESIMFDDPNVGSESASRQQMRGRYYPGMPTTERAQPAKAKGPQPVFVSTTVSADVAFKAVEPDELLITSQALQEKIKAAALGGLKEIGKLTPQEEELLEEKGLRGEPTEDGMPKRGEPVCLFVAKITDADRAKAVAEAYQKARTQAARLARAAEAELGELRNLSENATFGGGDDEGMNPYYMQAMYGRVGATTNSSEVVGPATGRVAWRVNVGAQFALKGGK